MMEPFMFLLFGLVLTVSASPAKYERIFQFGDSLSDTGNLLFCNCDPSSGCRYLPYGETFFGHPTGRCSNGRLIIDFIAQELGLPYLPPYLALKKAQEDSQDGVNFAVLGATALGAEYFYERNVRLTTNDSLSVQLDWFRKLKSSLCITKQECENYFKKSLFFVGEIGGGDFNYPLRAGASIEQMKDQVLPLIIEAITNATSFLVEEGAVELVVPGNLPIGCFPLYLTMYQSSNKGDYDPRNGCLKELNDLVEHQNKKLKQALQILRVKYPHANIIYGDYYNPAMRIFRYPLSYGFTRVLEACCGGGGPYNYNSSAKCGHPGSVACEHPSASIAWDEIHLTEAAYRWISRSLISDIFPQLQDM